MGTSKARENRRKRNKARREALTSRKINFDRRRKGLAADEDEAEIAHWWRRIAQFVIDQLLLGLLTIVFYSLVANLADVQSMPPIVSLAPQLIFGLCYVIPTVAMRGQTIGMRKLSIMTIRSDGQGLLSVSQSTLRWAGLYLLPNAFVLLSSSGQSIEEQAMVGIIGIVLLVVVVAPVFFTKNRQGIHDFLGSSVVIKAISE